MKQQGIKKINLQAFLGEIQNQKMSQKGRFSAVDVDRKNVLDLNILVGVDISGSISQAMFSDFMRQVNAIKGMSRIKVMEVGSEIAAFYDFECARPRSVVRRRGGWGNGEHLFFPEAKKMKPDAILYMTDGYCTNANNPDIPTGFILTKDGVMPYSWGFEVGRLKH